MPLLLCSRFPVELCWYDDAWEWWYATGLFTFLPVDEGDSEVEVEEGKETEGDEIEIEVEDGVGWARRST
jgi:hypothetical protein